MESSETLHVILDIEKWDPSTGKIASPSFKCCCSNKGTNKKLCSRPCTMSLYSFVGQKNHPMAITFQNHLFSQKSDTQYPKSAPITTQLHELHKTIKTQDEKTRVATRLNAQFNRNKH
jgi:hypothetical protein